MFDVGSGTRTLWRPVLLVWLMLLILGFGIMVAMVPQTRIYEDIICRRYYMDHPEQSAAVAIPPDGAHSQQGLDENLCKKPEIQDAVNELFGWQTFFDGIPGLLLAMYYGSLADTKGRRPVLILSLVGQLLGATWTLFVCWTEAEVRLIWLSSIFTCIGGGNTVFTAAAMMILADATSDTSRTRIFFYAGTSLILGQMLGPPVAAALMARNPWIPNILGYICMAMVTVMAFLMPETLTTGNDYGIANGQGASSHNCAPSGVLQPLKSVVQHAVTTLSFVFRDRNLLLLVASYFTVDFARETLALLVRYVSTRFSIPLAQASILLSVNASGQLIASAVLLPLVDAILAQRLRRSPSRKDLVMARITIVFVTLGFAILVLAPKLVFIYIGVAIYTLGTGFQASTKSLLGAMVDKAALGTVFSTLSLMDTVGALFAGPIDALLMKHSLRMEGVWQGLPFMFAFFCCAASTFALAYVNIQHHDSLEEAGYDEQRPLINGTSQSEDGQRT